MTGFGYEPETVIVVVVMEIVLSLVISRDQSILGIPMDAMGPMGMGIAKLLFHGNGNGNGLMGMGGNENSTFSHFQSEERTSPSVVLH